MRTVLHIHLPWCMYIRHIIITCIHLRRRRLVAMHCLLARRHWLSIASHRIRLRLSSHCTCLTNVSQGFPSFPAWVAGPSPLASLAPSLAVMAPAQTFVYVCRGVGHCARDMPARCRHLARSASCRTLACSLLAPSSHLLYSPSAPPPPGGPCRPICLALKIKH